MNSKLYSHEYQKKVFLDISWKIDKEVKKPLWKIVQNSTPSDTLKSRRFSLLAPIKKELDPAVSSWLHRSGYDSTLKFSSFFDSPIPDSISLLQDLAKQGHTDDWFCSNVFSSTCDALIEFLYFCADHPSYHIPVVKFEPNKRESNSSFMPSKGRGIALGTRVQEEKSSIPDYLRSTYKSLKTQGLCTACGAPSLAAEERMRQLLLKPEKPIEEMLQSGTQYYSKYRGSLEVCGEHSEKLSGSNAAKHGRRWRVCFLSLLFAMRYRTVLKEMNSLFHPSFEIAFASMALQNKVSQSSLKKIAGAIPSLLSADRTEHKNAANQIVANIKLIFLNLKLVEKPYDPSTYLAGITLGVHNGVTLLNANAFGIYRWQQTSPNISPPTLRTE